MARKRALHPGEDARLDMTPMIDVTFLLLVFFLCTLRFKTFEGKLTAYLPKDVGLVSVPATSIEPITAVLRVTDAGERRSEADPARAWDGGGRWVFAGREVAYRVGPWAVATPAELAARVADLRARTPERDVKLDVGAGAIQGEVIDVIDALRAAGIDDVVLRGAAR